MDIQNLMDVMSEQRKSNATNMTIGELQEKLNDFKDDEQFIFTDDELFLDDSFDSYRGYYEDLAIGLSRADNGINSIGQLKEILRKALEQGTMTGYKGGDYSITKDTLLWLSSYGTTTDSRMIIDVCRINGQIVIIVKYD